MFWWRINATGFFSLVGNLLGGLTPLGKMNSSCVGIHRGDYCVIISLVSSSPTAAPQAQRLINKLENKGNALPHAPITSLADFSLCRHFHITCAAGLERCCCLFKSWNRLDNP